MRLHEEAQRKLYIDCLNALSSRKIVAHVDVLSILTWNFVRYVLITKKKVNEDKNINVI